MKIYKNVYITPNIQQSISTALFLLGTLELKFRFCASSLLYLPCNKGQLNDYRKGYYYIFDCTVKEFDVVEDLLRDYPFVELDNHYLYYEEETK